MAKGRGLQLISLSENMKLSLVSVVNQPEFTVQIKGKRGGEKNERLRIVDIQNKRGRKGKILDVSGRITGITE